MMKRFLLATAIVALTAGGAFAQSGAPGQSQVKAAQTVLQQDGLYKGKIDGKIGPETKTAVSKFQKRNGLHQTARLDPRTMHTLLAQNGSSGSMTGAGNSSGASGSSDSGGAAPGNAMPGGTPGGATPGGGTP